VLIKALWVSIDASVGLRLRCNECLLEMHLMHKRNAYMYASDHTNRAARRALCGQEIFWS